MGQVLDRIQPVGPRRQRVVHVTRESLVKRRDQLPDVTDEIEANDAQGDPGQSGFLRVRLPRSEPGPESSVTHEPWSVRRRVVIGRRRHLTSFDVQVLVQVLRTPFDALGVVANVNVVVVVNKHGDRDRG